MQKSLLLVIALWLSLDSYVVHARGTDVAESQDLTSPSGQNGIVQRPFETEFSITIQGKTKTGVPTAEASKGSAAPAAAKPEEEIAKAPAPAAAAKTPTFSETLVNVGIQAAASMPPVQEIVDGYKGVYKTALEAANAEVQEYIKANGKAPSRLRQYWIEFKHGVIGSFVYTITTFAAPVAKAIIAVIGK